MQFDTTIMQQTSDATAPCTKSIKCDPSWMESAKGVVSVYAVNTRIKALGLCTGVQLSLCHPHAQNHPLAVQKYDIHIHIHCIPL